MRNSNQLGLPSQSVLALADMSVILATLKWVTEKFRRQSPTTSWRSMDRSRLSAELWWSVLTLSYLCLLWRGTTRVLHYTTAGLFRVA